MNNFDIIKNKLLWIYPVFLTSIGIVIHFLGFLKLYQLEVNQINHFIMLIIDILVVFGLLKKYAFGYYLAIFLYIQQSIMQPYWGYQNNSLYQIIIVSLFVITALFILIFNKNIFLSNK